MRKNRFILLTVLSVAAAVSCSKEVDMETPEVPGEKGNKTLVFTAHVDGRATSKTSLDGVDVVWSEEDQIDAYVIISDLGWDRIHSTQIEVLEDGSVAKFSFGQGYDDLFGIEEIEYDSHVYSMKWYAAYTPFMDYDNYPYTETLDGIPVFIPSTQDVPDGGGFADGANVSVAYVSDPDNVQFKNVGGLVAVNVKGAGDHEIVSILLSGTEKNGGSMTGQALVQISEANTITSTTCFGEDYVLLAKPKLVPLSIDETFYAVVAPGTYTGVTITFTDADGNIATYTKKTDLVVARNSNQLIGGFDIPEDKWTKNNIVFVDENVKALLVNAFDTDEDGELSYAEAETVTSLNGLFNGCGSQAIYYGEDKPVITSFNEFRFFTGITSLEDYEFNDCDGLTSIMLPKSLTSIGEWAFAECSRLTSIVIPEQVESIGVGAFSACERLETVTLPQGLETIAEKLFWGCNSLTNISIPESVTSIGSYAFVGANFSSIVIPDNVTYIGEVAFSSCRNLREINWPEGVTSIERLTFLYCENLTSFDFPDGLESIGLEAFEGAGLTELSLPESVTSIGNRAFKATDLETLVFPSNVSEMGTGVFERCYNLTQIEIPEGVYNLGVGTFAECSRLESVIIPKTVWEIGDQVFYKCTGLQNVILNTGEDEWGDYVGVGTIGENAFAGCSKLGSITIPKTVLSIGNKAFYQCNNLRNVTLAKAEENELGDVLGVQSIGTKAFAECKYITDVEFPSSLTNLGDSAFFKTGLYEVSLASTAVNHIGIGAFSYCSNLREVVFPRLIAEDEWGYPYFELRAKAFAHCESLGSITIPEGVYEIPEECFDGCTRLASIDLPATLNEFKARSFRNCALRSVTVPGEYFYEIADEAFMGCGNLTSLTLLAPALLDPDYYYYDLGNSIFDGTASGFKIYVLADLVDQYKSREEWLDYADLIEAIPAEP